MLCGGRCCEEARPPISDKRYTELVRSGIPPDIFEKNRYRYISTHEDGLCSLCRNGKCTIHTIKPETCRAGPFTFDVKYDKVEIYLKFASLCPLVNLLRDDPELYRQQFDNAVNNILGLLDNLTDDEIRAICAIEERETELIAVIPR